MLFLCKSQLVQLISSAIDLAYSCPMEECNCKDIALNILLKIVVPYRQAFLIVRWYLRSTRIMSGQWCIEECPILACEAYNFPEDPLCSLIIFLIVLFLVWSFPGLSNILGCIFIVIVDGDTHRAMCRNSRA